MPLLILLATLVAPLFAISSQTQQGNAYDPGACTKQKRGNIVVIKDRNDDDKIVVCVQQHGKYRWDMLKDYSYGNYFDPAKDCSHIVDNLPKAKSGVYWIQTKKGPIKAWCDVETDGGGFMLIGVNDKPATWKMPSESRLIHPHGKPAWSSAFGEVKVLDFRVQFSTTERFHDTRANWYYRFQSARRLAKLIVSNKGGCNHQYPGIGHVAYIKDLISKKITTRNFRCSRFGAAIAPGLGWDKMNRCFNESCPNGFAYLHHYHIDTSGSYSYSVVSSRSGIQNDQTSFVGCDHGKCCACFGPDSNQDYCAPSCQAINGGTVLTEKYNLTVWFWIRSSLPDRIWKKCMGLKKINSAGKWVPWHVEDGVMMEGSCAVPEDVTINDGVAVVPNSEKMNNLPNIEGLLSYRSDEMKLYLRGKSKWKALGTQRKTTENEVRISNVLVELQKIQKEIVNIKSDLNRLPRQSCKYVWRSQSDKGSGVYQILDGNSVTSVYCRMSSVDRCYGGGWTMVMKIDGSSSVFRYSSSYWSNKNTYNEYSGRSGFDSVQTKQSTYWKTSFKEICIAMKYNGRLKAFSFSYPATSLYNLIAAGKHRPTALGRWRWKSLIYDSSLQYNSIGRVSTRTVVTA